jgi:uncharacterized protein with ATP-grasp and redox domains
MATKNRALREKIMFEALELASGHCMSTPPPYLGKAVQEMVKKVSGNKDPYIGLKKKFNRIALKAYPKLKAEAGRSQDRLLASVKIAITGNVIDFGSAWKFNVHSEIKQLFLHKPKVFDYAKFKRTFSTAKQLLFIADNAGETVFDRVLIEAMRGLKPSLDVVYAVKESPILNDTLMEDALYAGLDKCSRIISSGSSLPGVALKGASKEFLRIYKSADIIIAKGMGNFELLDCEKGPLFFMLKAKCPVVAKELGVKLGDMVLRAV